ncbi:hypothetical protein BH10PLA2_BH10PLA2_14190 [soil metagenome]
MRLPVSAAFEQRSLDAIELSATQLLMSISGACKNSRQTLTAAYVVGR